MVKRFCPVWVRKGDGEKVRPCLERTPGGSWEPLGEPPEACGSPWELVGTPGYLRGRLEPLGGAQGCFWGALGEPMGGAPGGSPRMLLGSPRRLLGSSGEPQEPLGEPLGGAQGLARSGSGKEIVKRFCLVWVRKGDGEKVWPGLGPERRC